MNWIKFFRSADSDRKNSALTAKERLQIVIAHERVDRHGPSYLPQLRRDMLEVIRKYVTVDDQHVKIHIEQDGDTDILALNVYLSEELSEV
ncbi:cell division topological specificity factor MinE [Candidatus Nitrosacidococcus sp. I8]|uniref:cell division topological specificity factor MinE n=1 Tax=Candidatus Nitrosacidococcus sp. I8 TaxID=2942908 RepID=UPI002225D9E5|nr:cell division topological specificity factor MinE [Candidatus Nitrosacidococcus sp. I8]CAH9019912.1 Cell division topological specificity factor [Candidatus Nitrosacidococcus sp. I8]